MFAKVISSHVVGIDGLGVDVEVDINPIGLPVYLVVGLAEGAARESKERVRSALTNLDYRLFNHPVTVNLAPADIKKMGSHFDLPIAVGFIAAISNDLDIKDTLFLGELSLDGSLKGVSGVLCMCDWAKSAGLKRVVLPEANAEEALLVEGIDIYPFKHLSEVISFLKGSVQPPPASRTDYYSDIPEYKEDFSDVKGQFAARRAAEIAAAGMHNIIMMGAPGSGKTMIARRIVSILPPMSIEEALLTTKVHSVAGLLMDRGSLIKTRPFMAPHHTASDVAIVGGGSKAMPGHVSLATNGVLFLDEVLEFNRSVLEVLRQPLEDRTVTIARAGRTAQYPAEFMLVAACNPCPCGYFGDRRKECICSQLQVERYRARLSGPLMDRIDLHVRIPSTDFSDLKSSKAGERSADIRSRVIAAHEAQKARYMGMGVHFNSRMPEKMLRHKVADAALNTLEGAMRKLSFSARAYGKTLRVARTIADLAMSEYVTEVHMAEAIQYRGLL
ncbi:MAG: YifB family Mg chelatase-like AAA ATPase [Deferribacteraceae bacterium]|jgi:magnesium chelatase family protein|nr:YifB family Mg chelatase-like AAA ATPase [Deferribacteraceae bacterium]